MKEERNLVAFAPELLSYLHSPPPCPFSFPPTWWKEANRKSATRKSTRIVALPSFLIRQRVGHFSAPRGSRTPGRPLLFLYRIRLRESFLVPSGSFFIAAFGLEHHYHRRAPNTCRLQFLGSIAIARWRSPTPYRPASPWPSSVVVSEL